MHRHRVVFAALLVLAAPATLVAQTQSDRDRERIERERERAQDARDRAQEKADAARDREEERRERDRERRERDTAGSLDTVVAFDAHGQVTVSCPGGAVVVTTSDRNEIRVKARTDNGAIRFTSTGTRASLEPAGGRRCSDGRFEVVVPSGSRVTANTWSGSISVSGVGGDVEAHALSGDIDVRAVGGRLDIESLSGDVSAANVRGDASIRTVSGDVTLDGARGEVDIETVSGDLEMRDVQTKQVRTHTTSGDVSYSGSILDGGRYEFTTHSGEVSLQLPANVGAQLSVSTYNGGIDSDFPITLKVGEHGIGASQSKRLDFTLGQGSARILAETFSGDITLRSTSRRQ